MELLDVTSTQLEATTLSVPSPHSNITSPEQASSEQYLQHLKGPYTASLPIQNTHGMMSSPFSTADTTYPYSLTSAFSSLPLSLLQPMSTKLPAAYPGLDSMMSVWQAASMGFNPAIDAHPSTLSASQFINNYNNRKRKHVKQTTANSESIDLTISEPEKQRNKLAQSQPTSTSSGEKKDDCYWDRRRKNNEAAKRSRDARRLKETEVVQRASFLENENTALRAQMKVLKHEYARLQIFLYSRHSSGPDPSPPQQPASSSLLDPAQDNEINLKKTNVLEHSKLR